MTFLEIVKKAWRESGQAGDGPASVVGITGHELRFVNWVRDAWLEIQQECDEWVFLKLNKSFSTIAGQESYGKSAAGLGDMRAPLAVFRLTNNQYSKMALEISTGSTDEIYRVNKTPGTPTIMYYDNGTISFDCIPDAVYPIKVYYRREAQELLVDGDVPIADSTYHKAIWWRAVKAYARFDADEAMYAEAQEKSGSAMMLMYNDLSPKVTFGRSLF